MNMHEKDMKDGFRRFIDSLDEKDVRRELLQAYMMMERCLAVLDGKDTGPVAMKDNGRSSDLELFYACRKRMKELEAAAGEKDGRTPDGKRRTVPKAEMEKMAAHGHSPHILDELCLGILHDALRMADMAAKMPMPDYSMIVELSRL